MFIELWNHGTYGNTAKPCGEVDIYTVTGENIRADILKELMSNKSYGLKFEWFGFLPTEQALLVQAEEDKTGKSKPWLSVKLWAYLPE
jgi:hypothetical protein